MGKVIRVSDEAGARLVEMARAEQRTVVAVVDRLVERSDGVADGSDRVRKARAPSAPRTGDPRGAGQ